MQVSLILFLWLVMVLNLGAFEVAKPKVYTDENVSGWLMSEKLDGIRGYWDGQNLYTKNQKLLHPPQEFLVNFPPFALDGELYFKRGDFEFVQNTVLDEMASAGWEKITYHIFEVPREDELDFLQRLQIAKNWFDTHPNPQVHIIAQEVCQNNAHLERTLQKMVALGAEGLIVKNPALAYHTGRTNGMLKVKTYFDMEGIVVKHNFDLKGKCKSIRLKLANGILFNLTNSGNKYQKLPNIGEVVTFKYYGLTKNGVPKFASFLRVRKSE